MRFKRYRAGLSALAVIAGMLPCATAVHAASAQGGDTALQRADIAMQALVTRYWQADNNFSP